MFERCWELSAILNSQISLAACYMRHLSLTVRAKIEDAVSGCWFCSQAPN